MHIKNTQSLNDQLSEWQAKRECVCTGVVPMCVIKVVSIQMPQSPNQ